MAEDNIERKDVITAIFNDVGVNFGDHGETVCRSVEVTEDETVRSLLERLIPERPYQTRKYENFVVLRFAAPMVPVEEPF